MLFSEKFRKVFLDVLFKYFAQTVTNVLLSSAKNTENMLFFFIFAFQDLQNPVPSLLTWISFFYMKFGNVLFPFDTNLVLSF